MNLEQVAVKIIVNSGMEKNEAQAREKLRLEFKKHFPFEVYDLWNRELPENVGANLVTNVGKNSNVSVRFLIKDLETIARQL